MPIIRRADRSDARPLALLAEATFRETFGAANMREDMDAHCRASYSEAIQADEISAPGVVTLLAEQDEQLVGFAQLRWQGAPACVPARSPGEIQRLYVVSGWHGKGLAHELMQASLAVMQARGCDVVWLGVWERNPRAVSFYRKFRFVEVGDHRFPLGRDLQRDIVMARPVVPGSQA